MRKTILQQGKSCSLQRTARKKQEIYEKLDDFENRPSCEGYSQCKGYI